MSSVTWARYKHGKFGVHRFVFYNKLKYNRHSDVHAWNQTGIGFSGSGLLMILLVENFIISGLDINLIRDFR